MVKVKEDLTGQKFFRLTVLRQAEEDYISPKSGKHFAQWWVQCDCGSDPYITKDVKYGKIKSCGCLQSESTILRNKERRKQNQYDLSGEYGIGYTSKGEEFWFDLEDYDKIKNYCWYYSNRGYVVTGIDKKTVMLHDIIMDKKDNDNRIVDHIVHPPKPEHKIDNRKQNLRYVNDSQNQMNKSKNSNNTSGVTGVSLDKRSNKWIAYITLNRKHHYLGSFHQKEDAVRARKQAEEKYFGEYSFDNSKKLLEEKGA